MDTRVVNETANETEGDQRGPQAPIRVAVAGATGFAGQELTLFIGKFFFIGHLIEGFIKCLTIQMKIYQACLNMDRY